MVLSSTLVVSGSVDRRAPRNAVLSILGGTVIYVTLVGTLFVG